MCVPQVRRTTRPLTPRNAPDFGVSALPAIFVPGQNLPYGLDFRKMALFGSGDTPASAVTFQVVDCANGDNEIVRRDRLGGLLRFYHRAA